MREQLCDGRAGQRRVLANIERREVKAEDARANRERPCQHIGASGLPTVQQRLVDGDDALLERPRVAVLDRLGHLAQANAKRLAGVGIALTQARERIVDLLLESERGALGVKGERLLRDRGGDERVSVAITAHPRMKRQRQLQAAALAEHALERGLEVPLELRQDAGDDLDVGEAGIHLVANGGLDGAAARACSTAPRRAR